MMNIYQTNTEVNDEIKGLCAMASSKAKDARSYHSLNSAGFLALLTSNKGIDERGRGKCDPNALCMYIKF